MATAGRIECPLRRTHLQKEAASVAAAAASTKSKKGRALPRPLPAPRRVVEKAVSARVAAVAGVGRMMRAQGSPRLLVVALVGAVVAHNADGSSTIQTAAGFFRARGQSVSIGQQAEIEGNAVMRQAVTLPAYTIDV